MTDNRPPQMIEPQVLYSLTEAMARTGLGKSAFRQARRSGMPVRSQEVDHTETIKNGEGTPTGNPQYPWARSQAGQ